MNDLNDSNDLKNSKSLNHKDTKIQNSQLMLAVVHFFRTCRDASPMVLPWQQCRVRVRVFLRTLFKTLSEGIHRCPRAPFLPHFVLSFSGGQRKGRGANCKTRERRSASPRWPVSALKFRSMEPPCISFHPKNRLNVGLLLIHPEFCNRLRGFLF